MKKRYAVLGLSAFLALALSVPALGGPSNPIASVSASVKSTANKALKKAKAAEKTANSALSTANSANSTANGAASDVKSVQGEVKKAQTTANEAKTAAGNAQSTANAAKTAAANAQSTADGAKTAAEEAKTRASEGIRTTSEQIGPASPTSGTNTTTTKSSSAECPAGQEVLGGGFFVGGENDKVAVHTSNPAVFYANGWFAEGSATAGTPSWSIQAQVMCGIK